MKLPINADMCEMIVKSLIPAWVNEKYLLEQRETTCLLYAFTV